MEHYIWSSLIEPGMEHLQLAQESNIVADGFILRCLADTPFRFHYRIDCNPQWQMHKFQLREGGSNALLLELSLEPSGYWYDGNGILLPNLSECSEIDFQLSVFTNTLPLRRLQLNLGETANLKVAYLRAPELKVTPLLQRYTCLTKEPWGARYLYENLESGFTTELSVDADSFIVSYPPRFQRIWASTS